MFLESATLLRSYWKNNTGAVVSGEGKGTVWISVLFACVNRPSWAWLLYVRWYYPDASLTRANDILREDGRDGCFLVRDSRTQGQYSLSLLIKSTSEWVL